MTASTYWIGQAVAIQWTLTDLDGAPADADVTGTVTAPDNSVTPLTITHPATGQYQATFDPTMPGWHAYRLEASGGVDSAAEGAFYVNETLSGSQPKYATMASLRSYLNIGDNTDDAELFDALNTAHAWVEERCGRVFTADLAATARLFDLQTPDGLLLVDDIATLTDLTVETGSGSSWSTVDPDTYTTWPLNSPATGRPIQGLQYLAGRWPCAPILVRVTARWGWPSVPPQVREATKKYAARQFVRKDSPLGVAGFGDMGVVRVLATDGDVESLLSPFALPGFA